MSLRYAIKLNTSQAANCLSAMSTVQVVQPSRPIKTAVDYSLMSKHLGERQ